MAMSDRAIRGESLLVPGSAEVQGRGDEALLRALLDVELAWAKAQHAQHLIDSVQLQAVAAACAEESWQPRLLDQGTFAGGNPVIPLTQQLRERAAAHLAEGADLNYIHRGLTSQDVLDSALMLLAKRMGRGICADLAATQASLDSLMQLHRTTPMLARTLSKNAGRTTFGGKVAVWHQLVGEAAEQLMRTCRGLPLAFGGAAGNLAGVLELTGGNQPAAVGLLESWAADLGLKVTAVPWHVARFPVQRLAAALAESSSAVGKIANDVVLLNRDEIAELAEPAVPGRGGSSSMGHKQNPVLSILIRRAALASSHSLSQVFTGVALANDERPDVGWHLEWEPLSLLLRDAAIAAKLGAELSAGLCVDVDRMAANLRDFEAFHEAGAPPGAEQVLIDRSSRRYSIVEGFGE